MIILNGKGNVKCPIQQAIFFLRSGHILHAPGPHSLFCRPNSQLRDHKNIIHHGFFIPHTLSMRDLHFAGIQYAT
ncbi:hypothetical protein C8R48DRAFT_457416 [Suillus tomentosus]|nr:hypothetical protein C8R48DRAFT_457416 [Suillus tomentosus]